MIAIILIVFCALALTIVGIIFLQARPQEHLLRDTEEKTEAIWKEWKVKCEELQKYHVLVGDNNGDTPDEVVYDIISHRLAKFTDMVDNVHVLHAERKGGRKVMSLQKDIEPFIGEDNGRVYLLVLNGKYNLAEHSRLTGDEDA